MTQVAHSTNEQKLIVGLKSHFISVVNENWEIALGLWVSPYLKAFPAFYQNTNTIKLQLVVISIINNQH